MSESKPLFPLNAWYAIAWDHEIKHALAPRKVCNLDVVVYRTSAGKVVALEDACWHRLVPLSLGRLRGDDVVCGYHGLAYDAQGRCVHMPSQETINPSACVRAFPVAEKHRYVWVWPGDPAKADPRLIPDLHWAHDPAWAGDGRTIHAKCDYRLVLDNLMDLTHETFVHGSSIGQDAVAETPFDVVHGERTVTVSRWMHNIDPPPFWGGQIARHLGYHGKVDRWQIIRFEAPATIAIDVGVAIAGTGAPEGDRSQGVNGYVLNTVTPETDRSCHYYWAFMRNYALHDQSLTTTTRDGVTGIFGEDEVVLEAQQRAIDAHPDHVFYNLNVDAGGMWARRVIDRLIAQEQRVQDLSLRMVG
ncbi:aromatic ring-hydroxylating dioxygenase subunit alpha [Xanthomonas maliensis]|uniref:aromatic ring-hydroxylating dioxygenase subunit alpha n=1 Tax=Xanthomonas maliensis TaxID=1321368 RepID=UPI0003A08AB2|nr:aromatic ring-hydroxylating dioxygenase subunit alpha [Xanthomonas maliensis]KAB7769679.1 aromatic ring-hydroxylating dioxygenase subunit alpha [Xanthomonas maliensis]